MRILYVITKANWGGAQRYVYDLATAAKAAGHEVAVAYGEPGLLAQKLEAAGIEIIALPRMRNASSLSALRDARRDLAALLALRMFDVVHLNSTLAAAAGARAARDARIPRIVFTAHGWAFNEARPLWQRIALRYFAWRTILRAHTTICVSEAIRRDVAWMPLVRRKLSVIHLGIACGALMPRALARSAVLPGHEEAFWIGMLSELHPTKRVEDAIKAFAKIARSQKNLILVICGEGSERAKLEALAHALSVGGRVFFAGFVENAPEKLLAFDLFLHTSQSEALGYAILEAGCAELPVLASAVGGIPEIIESGKNGLLFPPRDTGAIAGALLRLIEDAGERRALGAALRATVARDFSKEAMLPKTLARYA